jgi:hypothetical protein
MSESFIKKIISPEEMEKVAKDIYSLHEIDNEKYGHVLDLKHDHELIYKSLSHESLLIWNIHVWVHFNGEKYDSIFIGIIRKSEKFNKKMMDEYLWLSKKSNVGMKLYKIAHEFAKSQQCEYISMNVTEKHPLSNKIKKIYKLLGYEKDSESYIKKI